MDAATLHCIICPTVPRFSDVSHLLTHVASKAHLSHFFKLQVRSHQEPAAVDLLNKYNDWYSTNDLASLLSDRMTSKDDRKKKRKSQALDKVDPNVQQAKRNPPRSTKAARAVPDFLDPRLMSSDHTKGDNSIEEEFICYATPSVSKTDARVSKTNAVPASTTPSTRRKLDNQHGHASRRDVVPRNPNPRTPQPLRKLFLPGEGSLNLGNNAPDSFFDSSFRTEVSDESDDKEGPDDMARLKGVFWPGMDLFDSATHQMRRKRNQRKDSEVLKRMERASLQIEPTELVFSPTGILRRERLIDGNGDIDSPLKGETPIPKPRPLRPKKKALQCLDPNVMRARDKKNVKEVVTRSHNYNTGGRQGKNSKPSRDSGGLAGLKRSHAEDDDLGLSVQAFGKRSRHAFTIYNDEDVKTPPGLKSQSNLRKAQRDSLTLTPARLVLDGASKNNTNARNIDQAVPGKENMEPIFNAQGRIDFPWNSPLVTKNNPGNANCIPSYYFEELPGVGFRSSNPLLAPNPKTVSYGEEAYGSGALASNIDWAITPTALSSEATVAEEERQQHDLQLYLAAE